MNEEKRRGEKKGVREANAERFLPVSKLNADLLP